MSDMNKFFLLLSEQFRDEMSGGPGHWLAVVLVAFYAEGIDPDIVPWSNQKYTEAIIESGYEVFGTPNV